MPDFVADDVPGVFQAFSQPATTAASIGLDGYSRIPRLTTGKVGRCARDMVAECQRCMCTVCRVNAKKKKPSIPFSVEPGLILFFRTAP